MKKHEDVVRAILRAVLKIDPDSDFNGLEYDKTDAWDSMRHVSIITGLENEFGIFIEATEAQGLTTYNKLLEFIENHPEID